MQQNEKTPNPGIPSRSIEDTGTHSKVKKHISDINDTISEEDIRNMKVGVDSYGQMEAGKEETKLIMNEDEPTEEEKEKEHEEARKINTSWNVLGE